MLDVLKELLLGPGLYLLCFILGMVFKKYVVDKLRGWVVAKLTPGIIQKYLEDMLGMNQKQILPPVQVIPVKAQSIMKSAPVAAVVPPEVLAAEPIVQAVTPAEVLQVAVNEEPVQQEAQQG